MLQKNFSCCISSATSATWHCILISAKKKKKSLQRQILSNSPSVFSPLEQNPLRGHCVNVYVCAMMRFSMLFVQPCVRVCLCVVITAGVTTGCLIGVRLRGVLSCVNSGALWLLHFHGKHLFGGLQVFNTLIYTSKQHRKGIVLKGGEGLQKEGGQGNEGCFIFSFFPSGVGRGLSLWGRCIDAIMIAFNQTHDQMEGFLLSRQKHGVSI